MLGHGQLHPAWVDVADFKGGQRGVVIQTRLVGAGPQHRQSERVMARGRHFRDAVDPVPLALIGRAAPVSPMRADSGRVRRLGQQ